VDSGLNADGIASAAQAVKARLGRATAREIVLTLADGRVSRFGIGRTELAAYEKFFGGLGLSCAHSTSLHVPKRDVGKGGYCNRFVDSFAVDHPDAHWLFYVGPTNESVAASKASEEADDDNGLGRNLRYPRCCIDWYTDAWQHALRRHQGDLFPLTHASSPVSTAGHALLNFSANYFGGGWTSFFPCSLRCPEAIASLENDRRRIRTLVPDLAQEMDLAAGCPIVYTEFHGLAQLGAWKLDPERLAIQYNPKSIVLTLRKPRSILFKALLNADTIVVTGHFGFDVECAGVRIHREVGRSSFVRWFTDA
jgi:hypothetical protein